KSIRDNMAIWIEGQQVASGLTTQAGQVLQRTFRVAVQDGQLTFRIYDAGGSNPSFAIDALDVVAARPLASAGPDLTGPEGPPIAFAGSVTGGAAPFPSLGSFGDGTTAGAMNAVHAYADNGTYTATFTVTDSLNVVSQDQAIVTITNAPPTVSIGGPY